MEKGSSYLACLKSTGDASVTHQQVSEYQPSQFTINTPVSSATGKTGPKTV